MLHLGSWMEASLSKTTRELYPHRLLKGDGQIGKWRQREEEHTAQDICSEVVLRSGLGGPGPHQNLQLLCFGIRSYRGVSRFL